MNQYTFEDIKILGEIFDQSNELQNMDEKDRIDLSPFFNSTRIIDTIYKENGDINSTLMAYIGHNKGAGSTTEKWSALHTFLFKTPLKTMALHLNDLGQYSWRSKVAKWRLQIRK